MAEITAAAVMALREKTGLPMMECKKALRECGGNTDEAVEWLRKQGIKTQALRADRETSCGRLAVFTDPALGVATIIEMRCDSWWFVRARRDGRGVQHAVRALQLADAGIATSFIPPRRIPW